MMFGALADGTGFSAAELESFDVPRLTFWWNAVMHWREHINKNRE